MAHSECWFEEKGKLRLGFTEWCSINILLEWMCSSCPVFLRSCSMRVKYVAPTVKRVFHLQPADVAADFSCFLVTFNARMAWLWANTFIFSFVIASTLPPFQSHPLSRFSLLPWQSSHCVVFYRNVSTGSHSHRCPDTSWDEKTFENFCWDLEASWRANNDRRKKKK